MTPLREVKLAKHRSTRILDIPEDHNALRERDIRFNRK